MTIYTAIIGKYDELKEPVVVTRGWKYVCFTDQDLKSDVWEIIKVDVKECGPAKTARYIKIMFHEFIEDEFSMWIDGTFVINYDLNRWWRRFNEPFTTIFHPFDKCIFTEVSSCASGKKGDPKVLREQMIFYAKEGVPVDNGLISSGILMRQNTNAVRDFCKAWWDQVLRFTERDQIAFGYVNYKMPGIHHSIQWDYTTQREFIHVPHLHKTWRLSKLEEVRKLYGTKKNI